ARQPLDGEHLFAVLGVTFERAVTIGEAIGGLVDVDDATRIRGPERSDACADDDVEPFAKARILGMQEHVRQAGRPAMPARAARAFLKSTSSSTSCSCRP